VWPDQLLPDQLEPDHDDPDQLEPDHVELDHVELDQLLPDQLEPDHVLPDQLEPDQELPDHVEPDQLEPDHVLPFHTPPDQLLPAASSAAIASESNGMPKMSCSPASVTPFAVRWSLPRAPSRLPVPVAEPNHCMAHAGGPDVARPARSSSPLPATTLDHAAASDGRSEVFRRNAFT
jgi:hypothetical protein